jgi:hypothetical protein
MECPNLNFLALIQAAIESYIFLLLGLMPPCMLLKSLWLVLKKLPLGCPFTCARWQTCMV